MASIGSLTIHAMRGTVPNAKPPVSGGQSVYLLSVPFFHATGCHSILVANLADFDPATDMVPPLLMDEVDRFALARYGELATKITTAYERYDFPAIFQALNAFVAVDLSAFYVDVSKDRLYTLAAGSASLATRTIHAAPERCQATCQALTNTSLRLTIRNKCVLPACWWLLCQNACNFNMFPERPHE